jgi:tetratricopeptide (TPR) repeat protein
MTGLREASAKGAMVLQTHVTVVTASQLPVRRNSGSMPVSRGPRRMRLIALMGVVMLLVPLSASGVFSESDTGAPVADADYDAAVRLVKDRSWVSAIEKLERAAGRHPRSADVHNLMGYAYRNAGDLDRAFTSYGRALDLDNNHRGVHEYIGEAWLMRGDVARARTHLRELDRLCRRECEEYRDLEKAIADYESESGMRDRPR